MLPEGYVSKSIRMIAHIQDWNFHNMQSTRWFDSLKFSRIITHGQRMLHSTD